MLSEYAQIVPTLSPEASAQFGGGGLPAAFSLARPAFVLGILGLTGSSDGGADLGRDHRVRRGLDA